MSQFSSASARGGAGGRRHRKRRSLPALMVGLSTLCVTAVSIFCLTAPGPGFWPTFAARHEEIADRLLGASVANFEAAALENDAALTTAPLSSTAWARKAYIIQQSRGLDGEALQSLEYSYSAAPYGPALSKWRLRFMFDHWPELSAGLRARAIRELEVYSRFHQGSGGLVRSVRTPSGRLAANLISRRSYRNDLAQAASQPP